MAAGVREIDRVGVGRVCYVSNREFAQAVRVLRLEEDAGRSLKIDCGGR